jgi:hypothetical protein
MFFYFYVKVDSCFGTLKKSFNALVRLNFQHHLVSPMNKVTESSLHHNFNKFECNFIAAVNKLLQAASESSNIDLEGNTVRKVASSIVEILMGSDKC